MEVWGDVEESIANGVKELTTRQKTLVRIATNNLTFAAVDVMNFVIKSAATQVIRPGVLNHFIRDLTVRLDARDVVPAGASRRGPRARGSRAE